MKRREDTLDVPAQDIPAKLPLPNLQIRGRRSRTEVVGSAGEPVERGRWRGPVRSGPPSYVRGNQLPWNPEGTRTGSCTSAMGSASMLSASSTSRSLRFSGSRYASTIT